MVSDNVYAGIKTNASGRYLTSFTDRPITKVIALVDVQLVGTNVVITSDEAFEGYVMLV